MKGTITARSRDFLERNGQKVEKIKYRVQTAGPDVMLEDIAPPGYLTVGTVAEIPVFIRPFSRKNGTAAFGVSVARPLSDAGQEF